MIKVGDKFKVRQWEDMEEEYGTINDNDESAIDCECTFIDKMIEYCGTIVTISSINGNNHYIIDEDDGEFNWSMDMFECSNRHLIKLMRDDDLQEEYMLIKRRQKCKNQAYFT